ncbi:DNA gyrase subunit A [bacterium NHP-B]|uniref:DNA gyrase subunit A n=1 Tax=Candidatus Hepatobacter penaei TaxID=1274402 RepID=A0A345BIH7_9PROT|nr:gyrase subunit alpha [Candidatus Hepatobacter penaei]TGW15332.1 DNA gyrase subunit A [bacterium NHP-B]
MNQESTDILATPIEEEMKRSYLDYAMSVIVSRALPDARDGLKPVHRRILYAMAEAGYASDKPHRKCARIVGDVMGKFHPHGDGAIYQSLVRMGQDFSMGALLIDSYGNFGSIDGDKPAAMRYTEARLAKLADHALLKDYDKEAVDFEPNYDNTLQVPKVLPACFPNLLVNGASGIAVGMATNIPPHNLGEAIDACCLLIDQPEASDEDVLAVLPGPDFPTGGMIMGRRGILDTLNKGRGSIVVRARTHVEEIRKDRKAIIVTEVPYQVQKARMLERIAELVQGKELEGIAELRDESDRDGIRVVIELKRDTEPDVVLKRLFTMTQMQTTFSTNFLALDGGLQPRMMTTKEMLRVFLSFREEVVTRRTRFFLSKARERAHLVLGLLVAVVHIDRIVAMIRSARDPKAAAEALLAVTWPLADIKPYLDLLSEGEAQIKGDGYVFSENQVKGILDLKLHRLTGLEHEKLENELKALAKEIADLLAILASRDTLMALIKNELLDVKRIYAAPRRTTLIAEEDNSDLADLIQREDMVVTFSLKGYIKRVSLDTYREQKRGGRGRSGMATRDEDVVSQVFVASTHTPLLFFSKSGKAFEVKVYELPSGTPQSRGKPIVQVLGSLEAHDRVATLLPVPENPSLWEEFSVIFVTSKGHIRRNALSDFQNIRANGKIAMKLEESGERLVSVHMCKEDQDVLLTTKNGRAIRFGVSELRLFQSRSSTGVRGIRLQAGDEVVSMAILGGTQYTAEEREAYLRMVSQKRRLELADGDDLEDAQDGEHGLVLSEDRFQAMEAEEQFILTVSEHGFGKRTSAYAYRRIGRGGQGVATLDINRKTGRVVDAFPVTQHDQLILLTDKGQIMRFSASQIRIAGRKTQGVILFRTTPDEHVTSVVRFVEENEEQGDDDDGPQTNGSSAAA